MADARPTGGGASDLRRCCDLLDERGNWSFLGENRLDELHSTLELSLHLHSAVAYVYCILQFFGFFIIKLKNMNTNVFLYTIYRYYSLHIMSH